MKPYYSTEALQAKLRLEAEAWLGTPFAENCAVRGRQGGVSCERYQVAVHTATGACPPVELPTLAVEKVRRWHEHYRESVILEWLDLPEIRGRVRRVDEAEEPMVGDIAIVKVQQTEHHVGLWAGAWLYHVAIPAGVVRWSTRDPQLRPAIRCFYRISAWPS
jgi:hypothetical protein